MNTCAGITIRRDFSKELHMSVKIQPAGSSKLNDQAVVRFS
jgi:hypothetical protein